MSTRHGYEGLGACPYGHQLGTGRVTIGWWPCECPNAQAAAYGHQITTCLPCREEGWTTRRYDPPHPRTAADVAAELLAVEAAYERTQAVVERLGGRDDPRARRAVGQLARIGQVRDQMEAVRARRAAAELAAHERTRERRSRNV